MTLVLTHHKCASTWLSAYLADYAARNARTFAHTHLSRTLPQGDVVLLRNAEYAFVAERCAGGVHIIRNPLDIIVSAYHSHLATHPLDGWPELGAQREVLRGVGTAEGMHLTLTFLERDDFFNGAVGPLHALRHWDFDDPRFVTLRMEDVVAGASLTLAQTLTGVVPDDADYTFERIAGRPPGEVDGSSHYRVGRSDRWREELPASVAAYVRAHYAPLLARFYPEAVRT